MKNILLFAFFCFSSFVLKAQAVGSALNFDGVDDNIIISNNSALELSTGTIEFWVKPTWTGTAGSNPCMLAMRDFTSTRYSLHMANDRSGLYLWNGTTSQELFYTFNAGSWYHVAYVAIGNTTEIFVNGSSIGILPFGFSTLTGLPLCIGASNTGGEFFQGEIDEVRIWNVARTPCQIYSYMNCEIPTSASGLVANYHFNQGVASANNSAVTSLLNSTGASYNGSLMNFSLNGTTSNWVSPGGVTSGNIAPSACSTNGNAISLDGVDDCVVIANQTTTEFAGWAPYTVEAWIKPINPSNSMVIAGMLNGSVSASWNFSLEPNGVLSSYRNVGPWAVTSPTNSVIYNAWNRVTTTYDGSSTLSIYVNGNLVASSNTFTSSQPGSTAPLIIGACLSNNNPTGFFQGKIDQVDIWNQCLSLSEINQYMSCPPLGTESGLVGNWNFNEGSGLVSHDNTIYVDHGTLTNGAAWTTDVPIDCNTNGISSLTTEGYLNVFPNPTTVELTIEIDNHLVGQDYVIYDQLGRQLSFGKITEIENTISIASFADGTYFLQIGENTLKVIKKSAN